MPLYPIRWTREALDTVPEDILRELTTFADHGHSWNLSSFIQAVLRNDIQHAVTTGSDRQLVALGFVLRTIIRELPTGSFGTVKKARGWRGLEALDRQG